MRGTIAAAVVFLGLGGTASAADGAGTPSRSAAAEPDYGVPGVTVEAETVIGRGYSLAYLTGRVQVAVKPVEQGTVQLTLRDDAEGADEAAVDATFMLGKHRYELRMGELGTGGSGGEGGGTPLTPERADVEAGGTFFGTPDLMQLPAAPVMVRTRGHALLTRDGSTLSTGALVDVVVLENGILGANNDKVVKPSEVGGPEVHLLVSGLPATKESPEGKAHLVFGSIRVAFERRLEAEVPRDVPEEFKDEASEED